MHLEDYNQRVMRLLMTCKDAMQWKDSVVFPRLPSINTITSYKNDGRINQIPKRFHRVSIRDVEGRDYFKENQDGLINHHCKVLNYNIFNDNLPILPAGLIPDHFTKIIVYGLIEVGSIPPFTTHLYLESKTSDRQEIYKQLFPETLEVLDISNGVIGKSNSNIDDLLPPNIKKLFIEAFLVHPYLFKLKQLNCLTIKKVCDVYYHHHTKCLYASCHLEPTTLLAGSIPLSVTTLFLDGYFEVEKGAITSSVTTLGLVDTDPPNYSNLPADSISTLFIIGLKDQLDATLYPKSIKYFGIYGEYEFALKSCIPPSTKYFDYQNSDTSKIKFHSNDIPNGVTHIRLGCQFDESLVPGFIPDSCEYLEFSSIYDREPFWWSCQRV
ncbi:hypothetical protein DFA_12277 [Cavenderia fasciculata]|uniref:FNIP repeat-containing protein n=1 Tax=Cavenderia fasciculata TaxID=261658 RepID=F4QCX7_CACFS|nr:uncharacterized protein DFA_12277 [Cavenderia fasciculata]EGG14501.1 hypothetical protein DFA_12277 [Cavenderia fasciculata]|eukprot:XP_004353910.1 hypothetical protein DFA_12277 [Cavenderia fasciculata]